MDYGPSIGDVYRMKGGRKGGGYWVIVGQTDKMSVCLGLDDAGNVVSSTNYYTDVMDRRERVGFVQNIDDLTLSIQWERN
ncbi:hypothetical protein WL21_32670 [Burkholderia ubonensis]|nr:hypothetical protein WJ81_02590 [Burkholderia ubonensis]KVZ58443.1 hypothetical protein WL20_22245 [Burkholderia ubonensis]KVZ75162.1 hypothetical protein WL21_32670 [Burkholderia ubonensis]